MKFSMICEGDQVFTEADDETEAHKKLCGAFGEIPRELVSINQVDEIPEGADTL